MKVVCPSPIGWSKVPGIFLNPGVCPVMRFAFLIPAITALGLAGCQVPPPVTTTPVTTPATASVSAPTTAPISASTTAQSTAPATPDTSTASETGADIVMETDAQTSLDDSTANQPVTNQPAGNQPVAVPDAAATEAASPEVASPAGASPAGDEVVSSTQESVGETIAPDDGGQEATPEAEIDAQAAAEPESEPKAEPAPQVTSEAGAEPVEPGAAPGAEIADKAPPATTELALAAPPPPPPPPPPELAPQALIGLDPAGLQQRLGEADFKRREGPVETWQYRFPACVVDYFLYPDAANPAVRNWAWRSPVIGGRFDIMACRRALAGRDSAS